ncbi:MAG TPA: Xaa-Pro peptidase family protein [Anaerolineales bacterium]|nr:Xaa-Pro peptidase family protein [Anaerolineales bacterium]HRQ91836.1 Xaa-Pro peptidase family protein [Anaerolineales bacterium]
MKSDLPALMEARGLDALLIFGDALHNPAMTYFTGVAHVTEGVLLVKRGEQPVLFYHSMERDEAASTGLQTRSITDYNYREIYEQEGKNPLRATARLYQRMLIDMGLTAGKVAVYGQRDAGEAFGLLSGLQELLPDIEFTGEYKDSVLLQARATKDPQEIEQMRTVAKQTVEVVGLVADFLSRQKDVGGVLTGEDGQPVTVAKVKSLINRLLAERGLDNPHGTIFAPGAEGGVPHSQGSPEAPLRLGEPIVFDIYPVQAGGGYFADFTRTWCIGHASPEAQALYDDVRSVFDTIMGELKTGVHGTVYQERVCELFEAQGHPTIRKDPLTKVGYVHSFAHGLGLDVHERPSTGRDTTPEDVLKPGMVITVEPGLYYPERGLGVRIEDAVYMHPDGSTEILAPYPYDLVIPLKS